MIYIQPLYFYKLAIQAGSAAETSELENIGEEIASTGCEFYALVIKTLGDPLAACLYRDPEDQSEKNCAHNRQHNCQGNTLLPSSATLCCMFEIQCCQPLLAISQEIWDRKSSR